jgi:hypothetical protein
MASRQTQCVLSIPMRRGIGRSRRCWSVIRERRWTCRLRAFTGPLCTTDVESALCICIEDGLSPKIQDVQQRKKLSTTIGASNYAYVHSMVKVGQGRKRRTSSGQGSGDRSQAGQPGHFGTSNHRVLQRSYFQGCCGRDPSRRRPQRSISSDGF